jgi:hypothetical protein
MNNRFPLGSLCQAASAWSLPLPLLIGAASVVALLFSKTSVREHFCLHQNREIPITAVV